MFLCWLTKRHILGSVDAWDPVPAGTKGWQGHHVWALVLWVMLLSRINLFPAQRKTQERNPQTKNDPSILSLPSVASLSFLCFSLVLMLADTAGWKEINLHTLKYVFSEWNLWLENQLDLKKKQSHIPRRFSQLSDAFFKCLLTHHSFLPIFLTKRTPVSS